MSRGNLPFQENSEAHFQSIGEWVIFELFIFTESGFFPNALLAIMSFYLNMQLFRGSGKGSDEDFVAQGTFI